MPIGQRLDEQKLRVSALLWGREGTSKTTSALRMTKLDPNKRVLLVNAEGGAKRQALARMGVDVDRVDIWPSDEQGPGHISFETIETEVLEPLEDGAHAEYAGVVLDSFTEIARRCVENASAEARAKAAALGKDRSRWQVTLEDHGVAANQMRTLLRRFRDLPSGHLVITALERRDQDEDTARVSYGPAMGPAVATDTMGLVDLVGFCQVENFGGQDFRTATFTPSLTRRAKDRFGVLPVSLVDPFFDRIVGYLEGGLTRENDEARARLIAAVEGAKTPAAPSPEPEAEAAEEASEEAPPEPEAPEDAGTDEEEPDPPVERAPKPARGKAARGTGEPE